MENREYDVIMIGSGMGALATGSLLAQFTGKKVLFLEQHFKSGGFTHTFRREGKYLWDVGIHYIGDMHPDSALRKIFDIVTDGGVDWHKMPEVFEKFVYPDFTFEVHDIPEKYESDLIEKFPEEAEPIRRYFLDVKKLASWHGRHMMMKALPPFLDTYGASLGLSGSKSALATTGEYMNSNFKNEKLKAILCSQWGDYGLPPAKGAFAIHALIVAHYLNGGFYPVGGSGKIADAVEKIVTDRGGKFLTSRQVKEIILKDGEAIGVLVKNLVKSRKEGKDVEEIYFAGAIVSNAGAYNTYVKLVPESVKIPFRENLKKFTESNPMTANVTLYLGLKSDPRKLGFFGENHWIYSSYDHDKNFEEGHSWTEKGKVPGAYLSFPSLKDPEAESFTAEVIAFCDYNSFAKWKDQPWRDRDQDYLNFKKDITQRLIDYVDNHYPGFRDIIDFAEISTPVTTEHFTMHKKGTIYGLPCVPERFRETESPWVFSKTPVPNLYLTGADAASPGVSGALMGGVAAFSHVSGGISLLKVLRQATTKKQSV